MIAVWVCAAGFGIGVLSAGAHLWLLWHHLIRAQKQGPWQARRFMLRRLALRLAIWLPGLFWAVRMGLGVCLGFIAGVFAAHWAAAWRYWRRDRSPTALAGE